MQGLQLTYLFLSFAVGVACCGVAVGLVARRRDALSRAFLAAYGAFSVTVTASLALAFADAAPGVLSEPARAVFQYLESIVGFYGVMLTLPLFVHRVFRVTDPRRERLLVAAVVATLGLQHVTEFALGSTPWDQRGDWLENGVLIAVLAYSFQVAVSRRRAADAEHPLVTRVFALLSIGAPVVVYDLLVGEHWGLRMYPLWYGVTSVVVTWTLVRSEPATAASGAAGPPCVLDRWGLSAREVEVADAAARGLSNKEIAASLHISPNTVKTHMRAIFEKAGVGSRFELMSRMSGRSSAHHPDG